MASMMGNLIEYIAKSLVDEPDEVQVTEHDDHGRIIVHLDVAEDDIGRVIGRDGRIATAMRGRTGRGSGDGTRRPRAHHRAPGRR